MYIPVLDYVPPMQALLVGGTPLVLPFVFVSVPKSEVSFCVSVSNI